MATVAKLMADPLETWPTQEFTYLEPGRCANTTVTQRREWFDAYWSRSDPAFRDGSGAESFLDFLFRVTDHIFHDTLPFSEAPWRTAFAHFHERRPCGFALPPSGTRP